MKALRFLFLFAGVVVAGLPAARAAADDEGVRTVWNGFDRLDFKVEGRACLLVLPKTPAPGRPWIWRTELFDTDPQVDIALLARGWHVAYMDVKDLYGSPPAIRLMGAYYAHAVAFYSLSNRVVLEGFGPGGLSAFNFAVAHPLHVAALYLDAPVLDLRSWPGHRRDSKEWADGLAAYGLTEDTLAAYKSGPLDRVAAVTHAGIPIVVVSGDADTTVPPAENAAVLEKRYHELGGDILVIHKPGADHYPFSLKDPMPVVDFLLRRALF